MSLEREPADDRAVGHGHEQLGLLPRRAGVAEADLHHRGRNLVADDHADGHARDLQAPATAPSAYDRACGTTTCDDHGRAVGDLGVGGPCHRGRPPAVITENHRPFMMLALRHRAPISTPPTDDTVAQGERLSHLCNKGEGTRR